MLFAALDSLDGKRLILSFRYNGINLVLGMELKLLFALAIVSRDEVGIGIFAV